MLALERQKMIMDYLTSHQMASTSYLSDLTGASLATLRRDLNVLEGQGLLKKTHGGAQLAEQDRFSANTAAFVPDPCLPFKDAIARKAVELIHTDDILFVGAGMTCNLLCRYLCRSILDGRLEHITVVTTNITAVMELSSIPGISVLVLGGNIHIGPNHVETLDEYTVQSLEKLYIDKVFLTVDGIDLNYGYSIINRAQLPLYNHLLNNSQQIYLLANEGKFDRRTFTRFCGLDAIPNVITNPTISQEYLSFYREHQVNVLISPLHPASQDY